MKRSREEGEWRGKHRTRQSQRDYSFTYKNTLALSNTIICVASKDTELAGVVVVHASVGVEDDDTRLEKLRHRANRTKESDLRVQKRTALAP